MTKKDFTITPTTSKAKALLNLIEKNEKKFNVIRAVVIVLTAGYMLPFFAEVLSSLLVVDFGYEWARCIGFMPYNFYNNVTLIIFMVCYIVFFAALFFRDVVEHFALKTKGVKKCLKLSKKIKKWRNNETLEDSGANLALARVDDRTLWYYRDEEEWAKYFRYTKSIIMAADVDGQTANDLVKEIDDIAFIFSFDNYRLITGGNRLLGDALIEEEYEIRDRRNARRFA